MWAELGFLVYFCLLQLFVIAVGINFVRIRTKYQLHPRIICFILPLLINYIASNIIFKDINPFISVLLPCFLALALSLKLQKIRIIGITGSIATGKSTLTRLIRSNFKEIDIIDCDEISRNLRRKGQPGYNLLISLLGDKAQQFINPLTKQIGEDQRKKLNQYVFNNPSFRNKLTRQMGKLILMKVFKKIIKNIITGQNVMLIDAPLLFETKILQYICYPVVLVGCSEQTQIDRLIKRDGYSQQDAKNRIASQMSLNQKRKKTKFYLNNEGSQQDLINQFSARIKMYLTQKMPQKFLADQYQQKRKNLRTNQNEMNLQNKQNK